MRTHPPIQDAEAEAKLGEAKRLKWEADQAEKSAGAHRTAVDGVVLELERQRLALEREKQAISEQQRELVLSVCQVPCFAWLPCLLG